MHAAVSAECLLHVERALRSLHPTEGGSGGGRLNHNAVLKMSLKDLLLFKIASKKFNFFD